MPATDVALSETLIQQFQDNAELAVQQGTSKLRPWVDEFPAEGEKMAMKLYYGKQDVEEETVRAPLNSDDPAQRVRRWVTYSNPRKKGEFIDSKDVMQGLSNFQSPVYETKVSACNRYIDKVIVDAIFGTAQTGADGLTAVALPAQNTISSTWDGEGGTTQPLGLNLAKLKESRRFYAARDWDLDQYSICCAVSAQQIDDLGDEVKLTSQDYQADAGVMFSRDGKLMKIWNHVFVEYQHLPTKTVAVDSLNRTVQRIPTWMKKCVGLAMWEDVNFDMWNDSSRGNTPYMNARVTCNAARLDEDGVGEIECYLQDAA